MELYNIEHNGNNYTFNVIENFTEPCPECGIPACGKENIIWFEESNIRNAIIFDGECFGLALDEFLEKKGNEVKLPKFIKDWSELKGWEECDDYDGFELDKDDFLNSMKLLSKFCEIGKWITKEEINSMIELVIKAKEKNLRLKIVRG